MISFGLAVFLFGILLAFNTNVFGGDDHGHDAHGHDAHGHAAAPRPDAIGDWAAWSIVFRLGASLAACCFSIGLTLASTDKATPVLWMDRALLSGLALKGLVGGIATMGILTALQIVSNQADAFKR